MRLLEPLAGAYAWHFTAQAIDRDIRDLAKCLAAGDLANIADLHANLAGYYTNYYITLAVLNIRFLHSHFCKVSKRYAPGM